MSAVRKMVTIAASMRPAALSITRNARTKPGSGCAGGGSSLLPSACDCVVDSAITLFPDLGDVLLHLLEEVLRVELAGQLVPDGHAFLLELGDRRGGRGGELHALLLHRLLGPLVVLADRLHQL